MAAQLSILRVAPAILMLTASGCLGSAYRIDRGELARISGLPPESRTSVRAVQLDESSIPLAPAAPESVAAGAAVATGSAIEVEVDAELALSGSTLREGAARATRPLDPPGRAPVRARAPDRPVVRAAAPPPREPVRATAAPGDDGERLRERSSESDGAVAAGAVVGVAVVVATVATAGLVALAATEASRYDGWLHLHEDAPVYLRWRDDQWYAYSLSELTPEIADQALEARVLAREAVRRPLGRAPLAREGFAYGLDVGATGVTRSGSDPDVLGPAARLRVGGFPIHELGLYGTLAFAVGAEGGTLFNARYGIEVQALPLGVGPLHVGLYAQLADNHRMQDGVDGLRSTHGLLYGGGLLLELDVTTHFAFVLRGGASAVHEPDGDFVLGELSLGATVY